MIKYRVRPYTFTPVEYEVTRETDHSIWYINLAGKEVMERKTPTNGRWYETFEAAKAGELKGIHQKIAAAQHSVLSHTEDAKILEDMDRALTQKEMSKKVWTHGRY